MHPELLALMERFELCYELKDSDPATWLAPQLLPPAKPGELDGRAGPDDLVLRYRYGFLPKGMISRLTVRLHRFVHMPEMAWVTGVLFEHGETSVLVELLANGREIELRGRGPERKELLSVVASDLDALNRSFKGLDNEAVRACDIFVCLFFTGTGKFTEEEFDDAHRRFKEKRKPHIFTFFKNADAKVGDLKEENLTSLWAFKKKLSRLGHFHTTYTGIEDLKLQFRDQLDRILGL